jgi:hypothetical protein
MNEMNLKVTVTYTGMTQEEWNSQQPGTLETLTREQHEELFELLTSLPLGG